MTIIVVLGLLYASYRSVVVVLRFKVELRTPKVGVTKFGTTPEIVYEKVYPHVFDDCVNDEEFKLQDVLLFKPI